MELIDELAVQLARENPTHGAPALHALWLSLKTSQGWSWGPALLEDLKQHPHMVPFEALESRVREALEALTTPLIEAIEPAPEVAAEHVQAADETIPGG